MICQVNHSVQSWKSQLSYQAVKWLDNEPNLPHYLTTGDTLWPTVDVSLCQDPRVDGPWEVPAGDTLTLKAKLSVPSVLLIHVCAQPKAVPDQVSTDTRQPRLVRITLICSPCVHVPRSPPFIVSYIIYSLLLSFSEGQNWSQYVWIEAPYKYYLSSTVHQLNPVLCPLCPCLSLCTVEHMFPCQCQPLHKYEDSMSWM